MGRCELHRSLVWRRRWRFHGCSSASRASRAPAAATRRRPGKGNPDGGAGVDAAPLPGTPGGWTWVDVPGMGCDDGSATGVAVNPAPGRRRRRAVHLLHGRRRVLGRLDLLRPEHVGARPVRAGAVGRDRRARRSPTRWTARAPPTRSARRATSSSPTAPATCTPAATSRPTTCWARACSPTSAAATSRRCCRACAPPGAAPARVVIAGSSAGGYGATLNYDLFRRAYPGARAELVDDAGPLLEGDGIPADHRAAWYANWHLGDVVDPLCADCRADLSRLYPALVAKYPQDRMALLTSLQDQTIRTYFLILLGLDFEQRLRALDHRSPRADGDVPHLRHPRRVPHAARRGWTRSRPAASRWRRGWRGCSAATPPGPASACSRCRRPATRVLLLEV